MMSCIEERRMQETKKKEMSGRVVSKHLFNYELNGIVAEEVTNFEKFMVEVFNSDPDFLTLKNSTDSCNINSDADVAKYIRRSLDIMTANQEEDFKDYIDQCVHTEFKVPMCEHDHEVRVLVHKPTALIGRHPNAAIVYAHGGGSVGGRAAQYRGMLSQYAVETGVVYFNVDYRLAPESKFPKSMMDYYIALKHVIENACSLGIDPSKICMAGDSGGGYICFATMVMLAQKEESHFVKLSIASVAMLDDYCFGDMASMTQEERASSRMMRKVWRLIANDLNIEHDNPLLFPGKASDALLEKFPPTIIWETEFDSYITENTRMANRLRKLGRLLEFRVQPGMTHMSPYIYGLKGYQDNLSDYKLAVKEYLLQ